MSGMDDKVDAAYRSLGHEEPPAALDARILAASREALARPSASRRWAGPVSIAAVLVLAFGVTLQMQREQPDVASPDMDATAPAQRAAPAASPAAPPAEIEPPKARLAEKLGPPKDGFAEKLEAKRASEPARAMRPAAAPREETRAKKVAVPEAKPDRAEADASLRDQARMEGGRKDLAARGAEAALAKESKDASEPAVASAAAPAPAPAPQPKLQSAPAAPPMSQAFTPTPPARLKREANVAQAPAAADAQAADEPTRELEAIAKLRAEGRHEDADKALAEFRRKRPGYRIPDAMWQRVKPG